MEHRWGVRTRVDIAVRLAGNSVTVLDGRLMNVSLSGAFITLGCPVNPLSRLDIQFLAPRESRHTSIKIPARVVRLGPNGIGVEWSEFACPAVREVLRAATPPLQLTDASPVRADMSLISRG
jgi:PilZ domain